jgi:hypothetical protein
MTDPGPQKGPSSAGRITAQHKAIIAELIETMDLMPITDRLELINEFKEILGGRYCLHCGYRHGTQRCQCWNDD